MYIIKKWFSDIVDFLLLFFIYFHYLKGVRVTPGFYQRLAQILISIRWDPHALKAGMPMDKATFLLYGFNTQQAYKKKKIVFWVEIYLSAVFQANLVFSLLKSC